MSMQHSVDSSHSKFSATISFEFTYIAYMASHQCEFANITTAFASQMVNSHRICILKSAFDSYYIGAYDAPLNSFFDFYGFSPVCIR